MSSPGVSIALCTYNGERFLREQLASLLVQTCLPAEVVVCDDGSTDQTPEIIREFVAQAPFSVHFHRNPSRMGSTANFQQAAALCQSEFIAFCDQDDVWLPQKLERLRAALVTFPGAGYAFCNSTLVDSELEPIGNSLWSDIGFSQQQRKQMMGNEAVDVLLKHNVVCGMSMMFRSRFRDLVLPVGTGWVHDAWIALVLSAVGGCCLVEEALVLYRLHGKQQIGAARPSMRSRLASAMKSDASILLANAARFAEASHRVRSSLGEDLNDRGVTLIEQKVHHLQTRAQYRSLSLLGRLTLAKELLQGHYARFGPGMLTFVRDMFGDRAQQTK